MLAALTSAALPSVVVAGVFPGMTHADGIDQAQVRDVTGKTYDVYASNTEAGRRKLAARVKAAKALAEAREPGGLGFALDRVLGFAPGTDPKSPTGDTAVMVAMHQDGVERDLNFLTLDDCAAMGTAIGAIHRLNPSFLGPAGYPMYVTGQIRAQLTAWIARLKNAGHVPPEITSSWSKIMETEGLWAFNTCMVHGGFEDGDVRFSGSTIAAINNWQNMQVNDPARDLAWIFSRLDEAHRNAVLTAYGRMMGNRLDGLIMLRANLWVQMEQVGDFIQAVKRADSQQIIRFKAQVDRLAHQLALAARAAAPAPASYRPGARRAGAAGAAGPGTGAAGASANGGQEKPPSTITVGTLLEAGERRRAAAETAAARARGASPADPDSTGSADIVAAGDYAPDGTDDTSRTPIKADGTYAPGEAGHGAPTASGSTKPQRPAYPYPDMPAPDSSVTISLSKLTGHDGATEDDDAADVHIDGRRTVNGMPMPPTIAPISPLSRVVTSGTFDAPAASTVHEPPTDTSATVVIPLLEREERALRDARAGLDFDDETFDDEPQADGEYSSSEADETPKIDAVDAEDAVDAADADAPGDADVPVVSSELTDPDDTPAVTPIVVAAPQVAVIASTGTVTADEPEHDEDSEAAAPESSDEPVAAEPTDGNADPDDTDSDDTGEAHTIPAEVSDVNPDATPTA